MTTKKNHEGQKVIFLYEEFHKSFNRITCSKCISVIIADLVLFIHGVESRVLSIYMFSSKYIIFIAFIKSFGKELI